MVVPRMIQGMLGDQETDENGPVTHVKADQPQREEWCDRRDGVHHRPDARRSELPGTIPVGAYRSYRHNGRWESEDVSLSPEDGRNLLVTDEWLTYEVDAREAGSHEITLRVAAADGFGGGAVGFVVDDDPRARIAFDATGGWEQWGTVTTQLDLPRGVHTLRVVVLEGGWKLDCLQIA